MVLKIGLDRLIRRPIDHYFGLVQCFELSRLWIGTKLLELSIGSVNWLNRLVPHELNCSTIFFFIKTTQFFFFSPNFQQPHPTPPTSNGCFPLPLSTCNTPKSMLLANGCQNTKKNSIETKNSDQFIVLCIHLYIYIYPIHGV